MAYDVDQDLHQALGLLSMPGRDLGNCLPVEVRGRHEARRSGAE